MVINAANATAVLTVNGTAGGLITVADSTPFWVGAIVTIKGTLAAELQCVITSIPTVTTITLKATQAELGVGPNGSKRQFNYGNSDMSAYLIADAASITQPAQTLSGPDEMNLRHVSYWTGLAV